KKRRAVSLFFKKDKVMLSTNNLITSASKLKRLWYGPFTVVDVNHSMDTYKLDFSEIPELSQINPIFHRTLLKPYHPNDLHQFPTKEFEEPASVEGDFWEVEKIMEFRQESKTQKP